MNERVLRLLRCPCCRARVVGAQGAPADGGTLRCEECARAYSIVDGVPRMVIGPGAPAIAETFGYQWRARASGWFERETLYGLTVEEERASFFEKLGIGAGDLADKVILDAGCGDGFLLRILGQFPAEVVGIDVNPSIDIPRRRCQGLPNVSVVQADILSPPFAPGTFDYVWCEGVLVCTPDPRTAFRAVSELVRPGGRLYVWVYPAAPRSVYQRFRDVLRFSHCLPRPLLVVVCYTLALPLSVARRLRAPRASGASWRGEAFALFDNLSPRVQTRHTAAEVQGWFTESGFADLRQTGLIGISGTRARQERVGR